jgi:hypothetical protein
VSQGVNSAPTQAPTWDEIDAQLQRLERGGGFITIDDEEPVGPEEEAAILRQYGDHAPPSH